MLDNILKIVELVIPSPLYGESIRGIIYDDNGTRKANYFIVDDSSGEVKEELFKSSYWALKGEQEDIENFNGWSFEAHNWI